MKFPRWFPAAAAAVAAVALLAFLLAVPYSFGVGTTNYSLGEFVWVTWTTNPDMQHGFLVLPAIGYLIYRKRHAILATPAPGWSLPGLAALVLGLFLFWAGSQADVTSIGLASMMIIVVGVVWFLLGWKALLVLAFPIAFFAFAIPIPGADILITFPLRVMMSKASAAVLNGIGIPVELHGTGLRSAADPTLNIPAGQLFAVDVADPCSGIRSLFALMMVSALYAYLTQDRLWKKIVLFASSVPLAMAGNLVRIVMLTIGTIILGSDVAIGSEEHPTFFHMLAGYAVFGVALAGLLGIAWLLNQNWRDRWSEFQRFAASKPQSPAGSLASTTTTASSSKFHDEY